MLICVVSAVTLFSMTVMAAKFPNFAYNVKDGDVASTSYTNSSTADYEVEVYTQPDQSSGVVRVEINKYNPTTVYGTIGSQTFPGSQKVSSIVFVLLYPVYWKLRINE